MTAADARPSGATRPPVPTVVRLSGEIDILTGRAIRERLLDALRHSAGPLVLDLSEVSFCDASGLSVLVGVQRRARELGVALILTAPRPHMSRILRITGLDRSLPTAA
ncbi:STAS domain-containing protein [Planomonospora parontospora]|uniref:STAS domain-containing protein n=1 Tax=Planomonospora parontospora TaxID=58119 RepID=UPI001670875B|nr:STAS domain-containing protein [Planomonospora parontospora]GGL02197.1 anti-sigma factor antagonist [Planomonospora parontospora subsp. antibiotica]GII16777.1 anti-sigma factor antagonist [Planomonospora parontospora subsp. antibiotica]